MIRFLNQKKEYRGGRLVLSLLLVVLILQLFSDTAAFCEAGIPARNSSGNRNEALSVDPIRNSEGFSAVLYDNKNGMPTSAANAIAQTGDGFIWIGSYAGLIRYDGNTFERVGSTLGIANIRCLYVDNLDRLWIGTNDAGIFVMSGGEFRNYGKADGLKSVSIRAFAEDAEGNMVVSCAASGLAVIDREGRLAFSEDEHLAGQTVLDLRSGAEGLIYGLTQAGDLFTVKGRDLVFFLSHEQCKIQNILSILPDPAHPGNLYVGTADSRIYYGNPERNFVAMGLREISPLSSVSRLEYIQGQIWVCAGNGIGVLEDVGFHELKNVPLRSSVGHVMTDSEGDLWFTSSRQGVMKIVPNDFADLFERYALPEAVVNSTCLDGKQLFIATDTGLIVTEDGRKLMSIPLSKAVTASGKDLGASDLLDYLDGVRIRSVIRDSKGRIWLSTWRKYGLLCYDAGELTAYTPEDGLLSNMIRVVSEAEDGAILVANTGGLSVIRDDRVAASYGEEDGIRNGEILTLTEGFDHEIFLGSDGGGIYIIRPDETKHIGTEEGLSSEIILRIRRSDRWNVYWIVTGNFLACMTPDYRVMTIRQFPYPNNYDLYENSRGDIWVLSSMGIYVVSAEELLANEAVDPTFFGIQNGLPYMATANSYSELTADGDLYIAGTSGVVKVNIEKPFESIRDLKIALPWVDADDERFYPDENGMFSVPANTRKLTLYPCVFNYLLIDPQVSYSLEGFDAEENTTSRSKLMPVVYTNLKRGTYSFNITVKDPIGHSEQTASFSIAKGKEISVGTSGTIIMDATALFLMSGILIYTSIYRKRGRLEDRMFFTMLLVNMAMAVGELVSCALEYSERPFTKELMMAGKSVFYLCLVVFPYLLFVYLDTLAGSDKARIRKRKVLTGIPCFLFFVVLIVNLKNGWIFSVAEGNAFRVGFLDERFWLPFWLVCFYLLLSMGKIGKRNWNILLLNLFMIVTRMVWEFWYPEISSTSFLYTLFLAFIHVYVLNHPVYEEASEYD